MEERLVFVGKLCSISRGEALQYPVDDCRYLVGLILVSVSGIGYRTALTYAVQTLFEITLQMMRKWY